MEKSILQPLLVHRYVQGLPQLFVYPGAFAVHMVDVAVDPETGKVDILRYTALQDAGKAVPPSYVEGQMQGGAPRA